MTDNLRITELVERILESQCTPEEACAECPELLSRVRKRLERMRRVEQQVDLLFPLVLVPRRDEQPPHSLSARLPQIEGYDIDGILGRGGVGVVYRARHLKLNRVVALKMLLAGPYASPLDVARFVRESQAIAGLQHPNIVQVYEVGELEGRPYFTMEFVDGGNLAQELAGTPQAGRRAAELVSILAEAVHSAHTCGIIHRDLKPANILLIRDGTPKIADFGLARHVGGAPNLTMSDARVGTPSYMAPEQALGKLGMIRPAVDIYALGAILYEMMSGRPPFRAETAIETQRQVITVDAVPPSKMNANVPRDLETICLKCLQKDPSRRYGSASDLADDLRRFLDGVPVHARPVGSLEHLWSWVKRNRGMSAAFSGVALLLALMVVVLLWSSAHFRRLAGDNHDLANEKENERQKASLAERREAGLRRQSEAQRKELRQNLYLTEMILSGQTSSAVGGLGHVRQLLARWEDERPDLRNWEWYYLNSLCHRSVLTRIGHIKGVLSVAWSPDGGRLASAGEDGTICIWDVSDDQPPLRLIGHTREVFSIAWSPDGRRMATASWDHSVRVWDSMAGAEVFRFSGHTAEVYSVAWSPDGDSIVSGSSDKTLQIWDAVDGAVRKVLRGHGETVAGVAWSPDSQLIASAAHDATVRIWDVDTGETTQTLIGHNNWVNEVAWSPDGARLASVSNDQTLRIWDPQNGNELLKCSGHTKGVTSLAWSQDATQLATASDDRTVKVWIANTGNMVLSLRGHTAPLTTVVWSPTENRLATAGYDGPVKVWDAPIASDTSEWNRHDNSVEALAWHDRDSALCASADSAGVINVWDIAQRTLRWTWRGDQHFVYSLAWHPAGTRLAAASGNGVIRIWNVNSEDEPAVINAHAGMAFWVVWSPDGRLLASCGADNAIRIWNATSGQIVRVLEKHQHYVYSVSWSPDGRRLASASGDNTVKIWDVETGEEEFCYRGHTSQVTTVSWSPDGTRIASAGFDQTIQLWDVSTGQRKLILSGHTSHVAQVIWSSDGLRLASACRDGRAKIWDTELGKEALTLESQSNQMNSVAWSPDGMVLATALDNHHLRIYDATSGYVAARSPKLLPAIDHRLAVDYSQPLDWRLRGEISAQKLDWKQAAVDLRRYLLFNPNNTWFVVDGLVAGPYQEDLNHRNAPEDIDFFAARAFDADADDTRTRVNWKKVPHSAQGIIDFRPLVEHRDHVSAYAVFPIYSLKDQQVAVLIGSDDRVRLWLNSEQLFDSVRTRRAVPDEDAIPALLKTGWNALLIRVANETGEHALYLRLSDSAVDIRRARGRGK